MTDNSKIVKHERYRLGHLIRRETTSTGTTYETIGTYAVPAVTTLTRPDDGAALIPVRCPTCQESVGVAVASLRVTFKTRKFWGRVALITAALFVAMIPTTILLFIHVENMNVTGLSVAIAVCSAATAFYSSLNWFAYHGIHWARDISSAQRRDHKLFREDQYQRQKDFERRTLERGAAERRATTGETGPGTAPPPADD